MMMPGRGIWGTKECQGWKCCPMGYQGKEPKGLGARKGKILEQTVNRKYMRTHENKSDHLVSRLLSCLCFPPWNSEWGIQRRKSQAVRLRYNSLLPCPCYLLPLASMSFCSPGISVVSNLQAFALHAFFTGLNPKSNQSLCFSEWHE